MCNQNCINNIGTLSDAYGRNLWVSRMNPAIGTAKIVILPTFGKQLLIYCFLVFPNNNFWEVTKLQVR